LKKIMTVELKMVEWMRVTLSKIQRRTSIAQGLAEFALILPVFLVMMFVLIELGRVLHAWLAIENGARFGVRYAVTSEYDPTNCAHGYDLYGKCLVPDDEDAARVASIHDVAWVGSSSILRVGEGEASPTESSYFNVIVCDPKNLILPSTTYDTHACPPSEDPGNPGDRVVVVVEFNHPLLVPLLNTIWPQLRITASREATVETYRIPPAIGTPPVFNSPTPIATFTPAPTNTSIPAVPTNTPGEPIDLCQTYDDLHAHSLSINGDELEVILHEGHGFPTVVLVNQVILAGVRIRQYDSNLTVERVTWGHPPDGTTTINVDIRDRNLWVDINQPFYYCYPAYCDHSFRGGYLRVYLDGVADGEYRLQADVYFPEYDETCTITARGDTNPEPTDTAGPSPTSAPHRTPTNTVPAPPTPRPITPTSPAPPTPVPSNTPHGGPED
jgi:hypothetical protein